MAWYLLAITFSSVGQAQSGRDFSESFETGQPSWTLHVPDNGRVQYGQVRFDDDRISGDRSERLDLQSGLLTPDLRLTHEVIPAAVFDEVQGSIWIRSTCSNVRFGLHLIFPRQIDPRTGAALEVDLLGDRYTDTGEWQQLFCKTSNEAMRNLLIRVRAQLANAASVTAIDDREVVISQAVLIFDAPPGLSTLLTDGLTLGPIVAPSQPVGLPSETKWEPHPRLQLEDDRILKDGRPFFPLFTQHLGEDLEMITSSAVNMLWVDDYQNQSLLDALDAAGMGAIAVPPPISQDEALLGKVALVPFSEATAPVWAWALGKEITRQKLAHVSYWARAVRDADRQLRRPVIGNVLGGEREFHRQLSLLGVSEYAMQTDVDPETYLERLRSRQNSALPGKPMFTFIATEPAQARIDTAPEGTAIPALEPEQIWLQGYTALAAGFKGIGFGRRTSFEDPSPGLNERALAMKIFNLHVRVLEPWLATGRLNYELRARIGEDERKRYGVGIANSPLASAWDRIVPAKGEQQLVTVAESSQPVRGSVFQTDHGILILLVWYEDGAQFVPGPQQARDVKILVRGNAVQAWEVTSTEVGTSNLTMDPVSGGTQIQLKTFDQHAAIVLTRDTAVIDDVRRLVRSIRSEAAHAFLELTERKLGRVRTVHEELTLLQAPSVSQGNNLLAAADRLLQLARREFDAGHDNDACEFCREALAVLRRLQRDHWENAQIGAVTSPMTSPYICSFQTLPEHWRMMSRISRNNITSANLLPSGDFEDHQALEANWGYDAPSGSFGDSVQPPRVELVPEAAEGRYALAITSLPPASNSPMPRAVEEGLWAMISPEIPYKKGELLFISGRVRLPRDLAALNGGFTVYDTYLGKAAALRFTQATDGWQRFHILRETRSAGVMRLRFEMNSFGSVVLDDLSVVAFREPR